MRLRGWSPDQRTEEARAYTGFLDMPSRDLKRYSLLRAIKLKLDSIMSQAAGISTDPFAGRHFSGVEADAHQELCQRFGVPAHPGRILIPTDVLYRDLTVASPSGGGYLVSTVNISFIDVLRNLSAAFRLGVQRVPGQVGNVSLPRQTNTATIKWLTNEADTATESTATFDQVTGSPNTASAYSEISRQLLLQSNPSAEAVVMRGLAADCAVATDLAVFAGTGTEQPQGILEPLASGPASAVRR